MQHAVLAVDVRQDAQAACVFLYEPHEFNEVALCEPRGTIVVKALGRWQPHLGEHLVEPRRFLARLVQAQDVAALCRGDLEAGKQHEFSLCRCGTQVVDPRYVVVLGDADQAELLVDRALDVGLGKGGSVGGLLEMPAGPEVSIDRRVQLQVRAAESRARRLLRERLEFPELLGD